MILMRTLRKDFARFSRDEESDDRDIEESGWKQVHGDAFRPPPHLLIFSSLIGSGHQLAVLVPSVILFSILGTFYTDRGTTVTAFIVCYAFTSFIGGYSSGGYYARNQGKNWIQCMLFTASLFPGVCFGIAFLLNFIAIAYGSLAAIPPFTMLAVIAIWGFVSFPLTLVGTVVGRNWGGLADNPCRINPVPRLIPEKKNGICIQLLILCLVEFSHLAAFLLRCILYSHHFGITNIIMFMDLCCSFFLF